MNNYTYIDTQLQLTKEAYDVLMRDAHKYGCSIGTVISEYINIEVDVKRIKAEFNKLGV